MRDLRVTVQLEDGHVWNDSDHGTLKAALAYAQR